MVPNEDSLSSIRGALLRISDWDQTRENEMRNRVVNGIITSTLMLLVSDSAIGEKEPGEQNKPANFRELAEPGPEHELLAKFSGKWNLSVSSVGRKGASKGRARSYMTLEKRFLWLGYEANGQAGRFKGSFVLGFDRRHEEFTLIAMDLDGTYFVTSRGKQQNGKHTLKLFGKDDDPHMKALGFEKEFAHEIDLSDPGKLSLKVFYIDTRTNERKEIEAMDFSFERRSE